MGLIDNYSFEYPLIFLLLIVYFLCKKFCLKRLPELYFSNMKVLNSLKANRKDTQNILEVLFLIAILIALASPIQKNTIVKDDTKGYEILLTLDASESMRDQDRFKITKEIVANFVDKRASDRLALSLFATNVYVAVPFTYDKEQLKKVLNYIEIGVAGTTGTSLNEALYISGNLFKKSEAKNKICILLTDGIDTQKVIALDAAISNVKKHNVKVYVIAVGEESEFQKDILKQITKQTAGEFFETTDPNNLEEIYEKINLLEKSKIETDRITQIEYYFQYPLSFALLCFIFLVFKRGSRR